MINHWRASVSEIAVRRGEKVVPVGCSGWLFRLVVPVGCVFQPGLYHLLFYMDHQNSQPPPPPL